MEASLGGGTVQIDLASPCGIGPIGGALLLDRSIIAFREEPKRIGHVDMSIEGGAERGWIAEKVVRGPLVAGRLDAQVRADRIQVGVNDAVAEVCRVQANAVAIAALEDVSDESALPLDEESGASEDRLHGSLKRQRALADDQVDMIGHDRVCQQRDVAPRESLGDESPHDGAIGLRQEPHADVEAGGEVKGCTWKEWAA
jgi:hypothetical protein